MYQGPTRGFRLNIGIFGRRNVGKSSILNAITEQYVSIVSDKAGTTTDPVEKPMELLPLGPVVFIDTAGVDDEGDLGKLRIKRTQNIFNRVDLAVIVCEGDRWGDYEENLLKVLKEKKCALIVAFNKKDVVKATPKIKDMLDEKEIPYVEVEAKKGREGVLPLIDKIKELKEKFFGEEKKILSDLIERNDLVVLVIPIDKEAPKGRIILPQQQVLRECLDTGAISLVAREKELKNSLEKLKVPPKIVITDSQAFDEVDKIVPKNVALTSFSILFSRFYGDIVEQARGARKIKELKDGDKILIAEGCTHHPIGDDIGRVKIPALLQKKTGRNLLFETVQGRDFPDDPSQYAIVIHCGNCMGNRMEMQNRINLCKEKNIPITNYGITLAYLHGILERALSPFPQALNAFKTK
ncbi:MAG: [FeFe] hydrogenase H-cluster maturation GTPase HydF [Acidobacteria bacterium]|nr:[FeFe] hydrogenase H-cluster maturation GTPase HydF [Acidobacteriota bacterium]